MNDSRNFSKISYDQEYFEKYGKDASNSFRSLKQRLLVQYGPNLKQIGILCHFALFVNDIVDKNHWKYFQKSGV